MAGTAGPAGGHSVTRLHIDWTRCDGRGLCIELLPEVLDGDDWGYPLARSGAREPEIPPRSLRYARYAVKRCPRMALTLVGQPPVRGRRTD